MPENVLPYGGVFVVQLDQSKGLLSLYHLCNSEIIIWGATNLLKNMPDFVLSYEGRFLAMQSDKYRRPTLSKFTIF